MAAPSKPRPGRYLAVVALALIGLYLGVFLGPAQTPALGLDLRGGTEVTLTAHPIGNGKVTKSALNQAVNIIRNRVNGLGVGGATVNSQGHTDIVVAVPGASDRNQVLATVGQTALLRFRQALAIENGTPTPTTTASPPPSSSAKAKATTGKSGKSKTKTPSTAKASAAPKSSKSTNSSSSGLALSSALEKTSPKPSSSPRPSVSPSPSASPSGTSPSVVTTPVASPTPSPTDTAAATGVDGTSTTPLPNSQSATLTPTFEKAFLDWDCAKHPNPTMGADLPQDYIIACDAPASKGAAPLAKYLLAPTAVEGRQVSGASTSLDSTGAWVVNLNFNSSGSSAWQNVTAKAYNVTKGTPSTSCSPPTGCNAVAIVLDGVVQSAPYISTAGGIPGGQAQITGSFTESTADDLANVLKYGSLPLKFDAPTATSVSATLGSQQLRGGLIAGVIGLGLVILFSLLYYRALGIVTVGSLAVSGLILYAVTTLLGHSSVGYTLSLPGIAGFIVAVGITADSFVVFFERLRDEIREGRRLRSGVERAWPRARRTIISADFISLLAAFILYIVSIGDVRGFAFTLGLSTISDLFIVFFFTKPLLTVLAKWKAFDSGKGWTGVGKARAGVVVEQIPTSPTRSARTERKKQSDDTDEGV